MRDRAREVPGTAPMTAIHQSHSDSCKGEECFKLLRTQNQQRTTLAWTAEGASPPTLHHALHSLVVSSAPCPSWRPIPSPVPEGPAQEWCKQAWYMHTPSTQPVGCTPSWRCAGASAPSQTQFLINLHRAARTLSTWHTRNVIPWCYSPSRTVPGVHPECYLGTGTALEQARQGMHFMEWFLFSPTSMLAMGPVKVAHPTVGVIQPGLQPYTSWCIWVPAMAHTHTVLPLAWVTITVLALCLSLRACATTHCHMQLPYFYYRAFHAHCVCPLSHANVWAIQGGFLVPQPTPPVPPHYIQPM